MSNAKELPSHEPADPPLVDDDADRPVVPARVAQPDDEEFELRHVFATGCFPL
jgi:hypothetical protein